MAVVVRMEDIPISISDILIRMVVHISHSFFLRRIRDTIIGV
jgi:hypothetical protein